MITPSQAGRALRKHGPTTPPKMRPCPKCGLSVSARAMRYRCPAHIKPAAKSVPEKIFSPVVIDR